MRVLNASRLAEYKEYKCPVRKGSTITVDRRVYSVPSRLIDETVTVWRYEEHMEVFFKAAFQFAAPWLGRDGGHYINYRHLIGWLVRKPGAFRNYRYHSDLFPTATFRWAYDMLSECLSEHTADREYLQILHHAAQTMECEVDSALSALRFRRQTPRLDRVLAATRRCLPPAPALEPLVVELSEYDELIDQEKEVVA
jgi:hypothetical protein